MKDYSLKEEIGEGSFAKVYKGFKQNGEVFAVKELKKNFHVERYIQGELDIIKQKLKHPNIVEIFEQFSQNYIYIVMEFCEMGNLNDYMVQNDTKVSQRISFMSDMALGVNYLHSQNIIHRDLKPENILLTDKSGQIVCKITDFGVSKIKYSKYDTFNTYIGSFPYMAPEITGDQEYGNEVDIFALGLLFYAAFKKTVLTNSFGQKALIPGIYIEKNRIAYLNELLKKEKTTEEEFLDRYFKELSPFGKIIHSMLDIKPENRPKMDSVLVQVAEVKVQHELNPVLQRQEESIIDLQKQNDDLRNELHQLNEKLERKQMKMRTMKDTITQNVFTVGNLQKQVTELSEEKETLTTELQQQNEELEKLKKESQKEINKIQEELNHKETEKTVQEEQLRNLRKQHEELQDINKMKEETIENMQKQNNFQVRELCELQKRYQKEKEAWMKKDIDKHKAMTELELKFVTKEEETVEIKKKNNSNRQRLQDEIKNKDLKIIKLQEENTELQEEMKARDQKNIKILKELKDKGTEVLTLREKLLKADQEVLPMREKVNQKGQEIVKLTEKLKKKEKEIITLTEKLNQQDQEIVTITEELNQKHLEVLSIRQALSQKDQIIMSLEKDCIEKSEKIVTMREDVIAGKQSHQKECEVYQEQLKESEHDLVKLQKDSVEHDTVQIYKEKQYLDELKQLKEDLDKKEEALIERDKNITELYKHIEEIQQMMSKHQAEQKVQQSEKELIDKDERRTGDVKTGLQKKDSSSTCGSVPEDKDMKADNHQAPSGGQASNKKVIYK